MKKITHELYQADSKEEGTQFVNKQTKRARLIFGTYLDAENYYVELGSHRIDLGGNERLIHDNKHLLELRNRKPQNL